jgi:hypothetical protein
MIGARDDAVLGKFAFLRQHLALAALALAAANRFQVDTEALSRL